MLIRTNEMYTRIMTAEKFCVSFIPLKLKLVKMIVQNKFKEIFDGIGSVPVTESQWDIFTSLIWI